MYVIPPEKSAEFVSNMEDVLEIYHRPYDPNCPVICMDEQPIQLVKETRVIVQGDSAFAKMIKTFV